MLKIKDDIDLKQLEKYNFRYYEIITKTRESMCNDSKDSYCIEKGYRLYCGEFDLEIIKERINYDWDTATKPRQIYMTRSDEIQDNYYDPLETIYKLTQAGLVEFVEE